MSCCVRYEFYFCLLITPQWLHIKYGWCVLWAMWNSCCITDTEGSTSTSPVPKRRAASFKWVLGYWLAVINSVFMYLVIFLQINICKGLIKHWTCLSNQILVIKKNYVLNKSEDQTCMYCLDPFSLPIALKNIYLLKLFIFRICTVIFGTCSVIKLKINYTLYQKITCNKIFFIWFWLFILCW